MKSDKETGGVLEPMERTLSFKEYRRASEKSKQLGNLA